MSKSQLCKSAFAVGMRRFATQLLMLVQQNQNSMRLQQIPAAVWSVSPQSMHCPPMLQDHAQKAHLAHCMLHLSAVLSLLAHQIVMCTCRFEGPTCSIDINECVRGTDNCAANAACINTQGMCGWRITTAPCSK